MFRYYLFFLFIFSIKSCPLKIVDSRSGCYCGIEIDGTNYIQCQPYSTETIPKFARSFIYDKLNLSYNFIHNITKHSFNQLKVKKIYLQKNFIDFIDKQSFNNNIQNYLEELHIDMLNNGSLEFLCYGTWHKIRLLELSGFNLDQYQICFEKFYYLKKLIIQNSIIHFLSFHLYKLPNLNELSLINNRIEHLNFIDNSSNILSSIKIFNLTLNHLRQIPNDLFNRMPKLHTLDLSHNLIKNLPIINHINVLNINLSYNLINYVHLMDKRNTYDLSFNPICTLEKADSKMNLILKQITQLHCDCRLAFYLNENRIQKSKIIEIHRPFDNETKCSTPILYRGLYLKDLTYEQLLLTCADNLPIHCKEVEHFKQIKNYRNSIILPTTMTSTANVIQCKFKVFNNDMYKKKFVVSFYEKNKVSVTTQRFMIKRFFNYAINLL